MRRLGVSSAVDSANSRSRALTNVPGGGGILVGKKVIIIVVGKKVIKITKPISKTRQYKMVHVNHLEEVTLASTDNRGELDSGETGRH